jgi:hypothetical protein
VRPKSRLEPAIASEHNDVCALAAELAPLLQRPTPKSLTCDETAALLKVSVSWLARELDCDGCPASSWAATVATAATSCSTGLGRDPSDHGAAGDERTAHYEGQSLPCAIEDAVIALRTIFAATDPISSTDFAADLDTTVTGPATLLAPAGHRATDGQDAGRRGRTGLSRVVVCRYWEQLDAARGGGR